MPINSKEKGKRFERELAKKLSSYGYECRRTAQYCGKTEDAADVVGLPHIHVEAKHQERMELYNWMEQAERDADNGNIPCVFHKKNNAEILVTMRLEDFMDLYEWSDLANAHSCMRCGKPVWDEYYCPECEGDMYGV